MSENETMILGQGGELSGGSVVEGLRVGIDSGEVQGVGGGEGIVIKKGEIVVGMEMDDQVEIGKEGVFVGLGGEIKIVNVAGRTGVGGNVEEVVREMEVDRVESDGVSVDVGGESRIISVSGGAGVGGNFDGVVPKMEADRAENDGEELRSGSVFEGLRIGIDSGEVQGIGGGQGIEIEKGEEVVEMEVDDEVKNCSDGVLVAVGSEIEIINVVGETGVGGNIDEVVPEMDVDQVENVGDSVAVGTENEVFQVMNDQVKVCTDNVLVAGSVESEIINVAGGTGVKGNYDEVVPEVEIDRTGNDVAVGTMNKVFHVVDEMCSGDISVGRNEYNNTAFEHFNSEGLNLVVDLGDLCGSGKKLMQRDIPIEEFNSNGINLLAESSKQCIDVNMEGVNLWMDLNAADKEYKDEKQAFENDGSHVTGLRSDDKDVCKSNIVALRPKVRSEEYQTEKDGEYYLSDMVWGKVRGHPWWPGQIFEPSAASAKAEKHKKKGTYLVAYFGDRTFAWNEPATLKPFRTHYVRMAKLSNLEDFSEAVDCALEEVSRRVEYGLSCSCLPADQLAKIEYQPFINSGIRNESRRRYGIGKNASLFAPTELLQDIELLAADPFHEIDKLRFLTVRAQLLAFNHWKGFDHLPDIVELDGLGDGDADIHTLGKKSSVHMHDKGEGRTRRAVQDVSTRKYKHISDVSDGSSIMVDGETEFVRAGRKKSSLSSSKKVKANKSGSVDLMFRSRKVLSQWDQKESSLRLSNYVKAGEHVCRVSKQLCEPGPALEPGRESSQSGKCNVGNNSINAGNMPLPEEILQKLCLAAASPMEGYGIMKSFTSFLSCYRNTICLEHKNGRKRKRSNVEQIGEKSFKLEAVKTNEFEGIEDSYWTDRTIQRNPEEHELLEPDDRLGIMIPKVAGEVELGAGNAAEVGENSEEYTPTELILKFSDLESVPSIEELNKIFSRYGPLDESRSVVFSKSKRAKVVFKRRSHAETAFSSSGKFSIFGHSLLGYCLKASTSSAQNRKVTKSANGK